MIQEVKKNVHKYYNLYLHDDTKANKNGKLASFRRASLRETAGSVASMITRQLIAEARAILQKN
jgi:hypothetical protein